ALALKERPEVFLATIQIAITLVGTLASAVGGAAAVEALTPWLATLGAGAAAQPLALGLVIVAITFAALVLGELTPKAVALRRPDRIACAVARPIAALSRGAGPLVRLLTVSTNALLGLLGQRGGPEAPPVSVDEIRQLLREGTAHGVFEKVEEELVANVFEFADTTVREVMIARPDVRGLDVDTPPDEVLPRAADIGHSRLPVYRGSIEHPVGVVLIKDLLRAVATGGPLALGALARPALYVPETARVSALLAEFQRSRQNLALVVDEYGVVIGLVTVEDVVEEIVGEIRDEHERAGPADITRLPDGSWLVDGRTPVWRLREALGIPVEDSPDYTTAAGLVLATLGSVPTPGVTLTFGGHRWTVVDMEGPRIVKLKLDPERGAGRAA
ncbi:MAG TPA: hemolysin family protein, partial [Methylomirabilota bacterium]|nr:hemolysin family protein [Methylomirabilota bacterium]